MVTPKMKAVKTGDQKSFMQSGFAYFIVIRNCYSDNIKIMPCVEDDRSHCQPEANSIARSRFYGRMKTSIQVRSRGRVPGAHPLKYFHRNLTGF